MLPAEAILRAAHRWIQLLSRSSFSQAAALIKADPAYTDLSQTQYASALDWLRLIGLIIETKHGAAIPSALRIGDQALRQLLFSKAFETAAPPWLADVDTLLADEGELPADATKLSEVLGLDDRQALLALRQVHGKIDLAERARVGAAGEAALVAILEEHWPGSTRHVSLDDDGLGYDIAFQPTTDVEHHLEVKSTTRRGRLTIYLSRHEHEIAQLDPRWHLIVLGLDAESQAAAIATATETALLARSPLDQTTAARWESVRHQLTAADLEPGLRLGDIEPLSESLLSDGGSRTFAWMPAL